MKPSADSNELRFVSARSLVLDLLSTMPPNHPVPVGALVNAAALFGIGENNLRVGLARLRAQGLIESAERGSYRLGARAQAVDQRVRSWRTIENGLRPWDGAWVGVEPGGTPRGDRAATRRHERALRLLGFRCLEGGPLHLRPDNLAGGVAGSRRQLGQLGLCPSALVFRMTELDPGAERRARALWDTAAIEAGYGVTMRDLSASSARLATLSRDEAMLESFRIGGAAVRRIVLDPLLPDPIIDTRKRRALVEAMLRYDRLGRRCWKRWSGAAVALARSPGDMAATAMDGGTFSLGEAP